MNTVEYIKSFPLKKFSRGELILQKGDSLTRLLAVRTGFIKVTAISSDGSERLVWIAGRYDIAPTEQLFSKFATANFFYTALTNGSYYDVDKDDFLKTAAANPNMMTEIARTMSMHYDDLLQRIDAVDTATVKERLLRTLHYLAQRLSADDAVNLYEYGLRLTHQDLAGMVGSTRETTSLMLGELRNEGLIDYNRRQFIVQSRQIDSL